MGQQHEGRAPGTRTIPLRFSPGGNSPELIDPARLTRKRLGQREWDLTVTGVSGNGFDWMTEKEYRSFADAYGFDIHTWAGFPVFRAIRELTMTTWLMQLVDDPPAADEFHRRVDDLRSDRLPRRWRRTPGS
jgi:hypothetical protein